MHTVLVDACTGCELCIAPCPVDCISLAPRDSAQPFRPAPEPTMNLRRFEAHESRNVQRAAARQRLLEERKQRAVGNPARGAMT
jgi:electron transport complex protein RnfB